MSFFSVAPILVEHADIFVYQLDKPAKKVCLLCGGILSLSLHDVCSRAFHVTGYTGNSSTMIYFMILPRTVIYQQQQFSYNSQCSISPKCSFSVYCSLHSGHSPKQPLLCFHMGDCCREVALYQCCIDTDPGMS